MNGPRVSMKWEDILQENRKMGEMRRDCAEQAGELDHFCCWPPYHVRDALLDGKDAVASRALHFALYYVNVLKNSPQLLQESLVVVGIGRQRRRDGDTDLCSQNVRVESREKKHSQREEPGRRKKQGEEGKSGKGEFDSFPQSPVRFWWGI